MQGASAAKPGADFEGHPWFRGSVQNGIRNDRAFLGIELPFDCHTGFHLTLIVHANNVAPLNYPQWLYF